ncbi:MAG: MotA/TolQ/ExbB proton channel family protein [Bradymonadia bacterium]
MDSTDLLTVPVDPAPASPFLSPLTRALPLVCAAVGVAAVWFGVQLAPVDSRLSELVLQRGWIPPLVLGLFFWGLGHALRRWLIQLGEHRALVYCRDLISTDLQRGRIDAMQGALHPLKSSLAAPVLGAVLSYFRGARPARDEVLRVAGQAMDRAYDSVESDYKPLSACMWLLPLTGFLGTVVGMAAAIGAFDGLVGSMDASMGQGLAALTPAVSGLSTAFDTTLLALILVLPLKLVEVTLEGRDRRLLDRIDATVGAGWIRSLDLGGLAQQTPEEAALDRVNQSLERMESNLMQIDRALARVSARLASMPDVGQGVDLVLHAAHTTHQVLPELVKEVKALRAQGDQPLVIMRGNGDKS